MCTRCIRFTKEISKTEELGVLPFAEFAPERPTVVLPISGSAPVVADSAVVQSARARERFFTSAADAEAKVRAAMRIPEYFLPVTRAEYSETGQLWLQREDLPEADHTWWVIDDSGDLVARATPVHAGGPEPTPPVAAFAASRRAIGGRPRTRSSPAS